MRSPSSVSNVKGLAFAISLGSSQLRLENRKLTLPALVSNRKNSPGLVSPLTRTIARERSRVKLVNARRCPENARPSILCHLAIS